MNKKSLIAMAAALMASCQTILGQVYDGPSRSDLKRFAVVQETAVPFRLYPTSNMWNFVKLDTRTGQIWMVQYSVKKGKQSFTWAVDPRPIEEPTDENVGRFTLYPTSNIYNFILLDQLDGRTWQVQFSLDDEEHNFRERIY